jgi:hypothetical protein
MSEQQQCANDKHDWERLDRSEFTSVSVLIEAGLVEIPIADAFLPSHRCGLCGICATIVIHEGNGVGDTLY